MADLEKHKDRRDWIRWAREFVRRGLWPEDYIEVHGPHPYPADFHWGEAYCKMDGDPKGSRFGRYAVTFRDRGPCRGKYVVRNVVMETDGQAWPLLKVSELSKRAQQWLRVADRVLKGMR